MPGRVLDPACIPQPRVPMSSVRSAGSAVGRAPRSVPPAGPSYAEPVGTVRWSRCRCIIQACCWLRHTCGDRLSVNWIMHAGGKVFIISMSRSRQRRTRLDPVELRSRSADETRRLGALLGALLERGDVVLLHGALGADKTAFTQGIGEGMGVVGVINSPTFTLLKEYDGRVPLYHFDLYRLDDPSEMDGLGFAEYFTGSGVSVVEWAERGESPGGELPWPAAFLRVHIVRTSEDERVIQCSAQGTRGLELRDALARAAVAAEVA